MSATNSNPPHDGHRDQASRRHVPYFPKRRHWVHRGLNESAFGVNFKQLTIAGGLFTQNEPQESFVGRFSLDGRVKLIVNCLKLTPLGGKGLSPLVVKSSMSGALYK